MDLCAATAPPEYGTSRATRRRVARRVTDDSGANEQDPVRALTRQQAMLGWQQMAAFGQTEDPAHRTRRSVLGHPAGPADRAGHGSGHTVQRRLLRRPPRRTP